MRTHVLREIMLVLAVSTAFVYPGCAARNPQPITGVTTPLHEAAAGGHLQTVATLIEEGADVNARDESGKTPLHHAAANGHGQTVATLLDLAADPALVDTQGRTARDYALQNGHGATAEKLTLSSPSAALPLSVASPDEHQRNPSLKYADADAFAKAIGQPACLLTSKHVQIFAPKVHESAAAVVLPYLTTAYDALYGIVGRHTEYSIVVYHFSPGHADAFGGTSNCVLYYDDANLRLDDQEEWRRYGIPHVSGYIEEMAHNFVAATHAQFGWEMVGWSIGLKASEEVSANPIFAREVQDTRKRQAETFQRYKLAGGRFPEDIENNLVDRIHAHVLWQCEQEYGPNFWTDFFRQVNSVQDALKGAVQLGDGDAIRNARYQITLDCFDRLPGLRFKERLQQAYISLEKDVKSLHPTEPGWNRRLT